LDVTFFPGRKVRDLLVFVYTTATTRATTPAVLDTRCFGPTLATMFFLEIFFYWAMLVTIELRRKEGKEEKVCTERLVFYLEQFSSFIYHTYA